MSIFQPLSYQESYILIVTFIAPAIAQPVVRAARAAFHPLTNKSLFVHGTNKNVWWKELMQYFTPDQIPTHLGGTLNPYDDDDYDYTDS